MVCGREAERQREMAEASGLLTARNINQIPTYSYAAKPRTVESVSRALRIKASSRRNDLSLVKKGSGKSRRRLITISTADGKWQGNWSSEYLISLRDLRLEDLVEDERKDAEVFVNLCVQKHASFGFSVEGKIITSFTRKCGICSSQYCREINTSFNVWVLPSSRENRNIQLPDIGGDDPSVIYVKPGLEADLDSLIKDTIRLTVSEKDTCSEKCEKSEPTLQYIGVKNAASVDKRWSRLLELRKI